VGLERGLLLEWPWIQRGELRGRLILEVSFSSLYFSSFSSIGSRPGTNGVGMGFYHLPLEVEFPRAPDPPKGYPRAVPIGSGIYEAVRWRTSLDLSFSSHVRVSQPRGSAAREGDDVTAAGRWPGKCRGYSHCAGVPIALQRLSYLLTYYHT
jgi:hypothetical protein